MVFKLPSDPWEELGRVLRPLHYGRHEVALQLVQMDELPQEDRLKRGWIEISQEDVEHDDNGRATFAGRQVLMYIKDQGPNLDKVVSGDLENGTKIHLRRCRTVQKLAAQNRGDRYSQIIRDDGFFPVYSEYYGGQSDTHIVRRRVCLNCLAELGFTPKWLFPGGRQKKASTFNFSAYLSGERDPKKLFNAEYIAPNRELYAEEDFKEPKKTNANAGLASWAGSQALEATPGADDSPSIPPEETWSQISREKREQAGWVCDQCGVCLKDYPQWLDTHHRNGVKSDNRADNLRVLCRLCHVQQDRHTHMYVKPEARQQIEKLRSAQRNEANKPSRAHWIEELDNWLEQNHEQAMDQAAEIQDEHQAIIIDPVALWPKHRLALCRAEGHFDRSKAELAGWTVLNAGGMASLEELNSKLNAHLSERDS